MRECICPVPVPKVATANHPNDGERCVKCSMWINPRWTANNETMQEFYGRLREALPNDPSVEPLILQASMRELAARKTYGNRFLTYDNPREGQEEAADGVNYAAFDILVARRQGLEEEWGHALTAAHHLAKAHEAFRRMRAHEHPGISEYVR